MPYGHADRIAGAGEPENPKSLAGRQVISYEVLVRITTGLSIPPERMGLSWWGPDGTWYGPSGTYPGEVTATNAPKEVTAEMLRRHLIALGGSALAGAPVQGIGELLENLGVLDPVPLPSQLSGFHVAARHRCP